MPHVAHGWTSGGCPQCTRVHRAAITQKPAAVAVTQTADEKDQIEKATMQARVLASAEAALAAETAEEEAAETAEAHEGLFSPNICDDTASDNDSGSGSDDSDAGSPLPLAKRMMLRLVNSNLPPENQVYAFILGSIRTSTCSLYMYTQNRCIYTYSLLITMPLQSKRQACGDLRLSDPAK